MPVIGFRRIDGIRGSSPLSPMTAEDRKRYQLDIIAYAREILEYPGFPTFQRIRLKKMMVTPFLYESSGYATGKTMCLAIYSAWRGNCFPEVVIGIISHTFRGAKAVFDELEKWYYTKPRFRAEVMNFHKKNDLYEFFFKKPIGCKNLGYSKVRCLPPDLLHDSNRMQGENWTDGLFDEWTHFGKRGYDALNNVLLARARKPTYYMQEHYPYLPQTIITNKRIFSSVGSYTYTRPYTKIKIAQQEMAKGNKDYDVIGFSYEDYEAEWEKLVDKKLIYDQKRELSPQMFDMLWRGRWQTGSGGPYDPQQIDDIRREGIKIQTKGEEDKIYVMGVDPATPAARSNFALQVLEVDMERGIDILVYGMSRKSVSITDMVNIIHKTILQFPTTVFIVCDPGGGGSHLMPELNTTWVNIGGIPTEVIPIIEYSNEWTGKVGRNILLPFALNSLGIIQMYPSENRMNKSALLSDADLLNRAHRQMATAISNRTIMSPCQLDELDIVYAQTMSQEERTIREHIDKTWQELCLIDMKRDSNGLPLMDSKNFYKYVIPSGETKDRPYALIYAEMGATIWRKLQKQQEKEADDEKLTFEFETIDWNSLDSSVVGGRSNYVKY